MPTVWQNIIAYLQVLNTPREQKKKVDIKLIYERIPGTDREILVRSIYPDGSEVRTIVKVVPPSFKGF